MNILVINCGSSSIKYQVLNPGSGECLLREKVEVAGGDFEASLKTVFEQLSAHRVEAIGHRVVHGGERFSDASVIDEEVIAEIEKCIPLAPLHNPANLAGIMACKKLYPGLPQVAVFDTAFHNPMPGRARTYAIDQDLASQHGLRRYGFHGTSHEYVAGAVANAMDEPLDSLRIISLHLGNGASACAIENGHSLDTSMGFTPLEGLVMGTRSGDIDAGAVLYLMEQEGLDVGGMTELLNRKSGLLGLSGISNDLRAVEEAAEKGNTAAQRAITVYVHRIRKYVGAYAAALGGVDAIVFTGGVGENSAPMRQRILQRMEFLGLRFDEYRNNHGNVSREKPVCEIHGKHSRVPVYVVKTNEELMIARKTASLVKRESKVEERFSIPIAISARHVHLDRDTMAKLFGEGAELTHYKGLSQPGQFAANERVNLIGPRNRIDKVRILGPLRSKNQIEVSRTDEFMLGVDAPVRDSGRTKGSAPITLEGPGGVVHLEEGLICARRHIHMHPDDAERFGVKNRDEVEVTISGGPRDLTFSDVLVRVSPGYRLEMHIDTDEGNAAELSQMSEGELVYAEVKDVCGNLKCRKV